MFLFFLFYGVIVLFVIVRVHQRAQENKKRHAQRSQGQMQGAPGPVPQPQTTVSDDGQVHKKGRAGRKMSRREREVAVTKLMEDREHDWLARQLAEERKALRRMSEMFDIRLSTRSKSWDAESLKRFHAENCSAEGVDDPTVQ